MSAPNKNEVCANCNTLDAAAEQPAPHGSGIPIVQLVMADLERRAEVGEKKYGERLKAHNGRDALLDAYQEALDLAVYLRQELEERESLKKENEMLRDCNAQLVATERSVRNEKNRLQAIAGNVKL